MSEFWAIIPRAVRKSKILTGEEQSLWYELAENLNNAGCCKLTNADLAESFGVSIQTISARLASLKQKGYLCITYETRNHARRLYPKYPGEIDEKKPSVDSMQEKIDKLQEACQKGIKLSDFYFFSLINKIKGSPILDEIEDNTTQFALSIDQIKFLGKFMEMFPNKEIDFQLSSVARFINYENLLYEIERSDFLRNSNNISLKWVIENYEDIVEKKKYAPFGYKDLHINERSYSREELNKLIQNVDEIEI